MGTPTRLGDALDGLAGSSSPRLQALWAQMKDEPLDDGTSAAPVDTGVRRMRAHEPGVPPRFRGLTPDTLLERLAATGASPTGKGAAVRLAQALAEHGTVEVDGDERNGLMLIGGVGTGKTALASWTFAAMGRRVSGACLWLQYDEMIEEVQAAYSAPGREDAALKRLQVAPLLLLDDLGSPARARLGEPETLDRQRILWQLVSYRHREMLPMLVTTNLSRAELMASFEARTISRLFEICAVARMEGADVRAGAPREAGGAPGRSGTVSSPERRRTG